MYKLDFLKRPVIDPLALRGYRRERISELSFPIALALVEGGFIGVIADKLYHVHPAVLALISAAPMFGNLSSFLWARLAHGRRKVPMIVALEAVVVGLVGIVALVPQGNPGAWLLVGAQIASRLVFGGIVTVRSLVWTLNYPRQSRSRVTSRLFVFGTLTMFLTATLGSRLLDSDPESFRWLYALGALLAGGGVLVYAGVPVLGEQQQLELERGPVEVDTEVAAARARGSTLLGVLRHDALYARYLGWQFVLGVSNMMLEPVLLYLVSRELDASYSYSVAITIGIPFGLTVLTVPFWAIYLDRVHIVSFRARHSWFFAVSQALLFLGALKGSLLLLALGRVVLGVARGGGSLAWQLGHNDFADPQRVGLYMGIHVTLTGLRGLFAPFLGMLLYVGWAPRMLPLFGVELPGFAGIGSGLMLLACALSVVASFGFMALQRRLARQPLASGAAGR